uniref:Uncharacterized protein n=1 Tax=Megaselia scalaris TaxID=36166 RepID=T1GL53_MEGSC
SWNSTPEYIYKDTTTQKIKVLNCKKQDLILDYVCPRKTFSFIFAPAKCFGIDINKTYNISKIGLYEFANISQWIDEAHPNYLRKKKIS